MQCTSVLTIALVGHSAVISSAGGPGVAIITCAVAVSVLWAESVPVTVIVLVPGVVNVVLNGEEVPASLVEPVAVN